MGYDVQQQGGSLRTFLIEKGIDPDLIKEFLQEQIEMNRAADDVSKDILGKCAFYKRELKYTQLERFIINLK